MNDRTPPPDGGRLLGWEPTTGPRRVVPGPWPASPSAEDLFADRSSDGDDRRRVPRPHPRSRHAPRSPFEPVVPTQVRQGTPPGGWPAVGSPVNHPARPQPWPELHAARPHEASLHGTFNQAPFDEVRVHETRAVTSLTALRDAGPTDPRRVRWHLIGYPAAIVTAVVVGFAVGGASPGGAPGVNTGATASAVTASPAALSRDGGAPGAAGVHPFGTTVTFEDGSTLTAGPPVAFTPRDIAFGGEELPHHVKFKVTFVNNGDQVFDPSLTVGTASAGDTEGEVVYSRDLDPPHSVVLPGKRVTWWMGFGVTDAKRATLTVRMGFGEYDDVTFTNE
jgi:hypothetical protein